MAANFALAWAVLGGFLVLEISTAPVSKFSSQTVKADTFVASETKVRLIKVLTKIRKCVCTGTGRVLLPCLGSRKGADICGTLRNHFTKHLTQVAAHPT